jgi:hypothetical protein
VDVVEEILGLGEMVGSGAEVAAEEGGGEGDGHAGGSVSLRLW